MASTVPVAQREGRPMTRVDDAYVMPSAEPRADLPVP